MTSAQVDSLLIRAEASVDRVAAGMLFALVDAARDRSILERLRALPAGTYASLYDGDKARELERFAPYLIAVAGQSSALVHELWGTSSLVVLVAKPSFLELRRHLRRFLMVEAEGKTRYFRFYDPRVLRMFLPECTADELAQFFGPIVRFVVERGPGAAGALRYERDPQGRLAVAELAPVA